jgi:hypothetical protein
MQLLSRQQNGKDHDTNGLFMYFALSSHKTSDLYITDSFTSSLYYVCYLLCSFFMQFGWGCLRSPVQDITFSRLMMCNQAVVPLIKHVLDWTGRSTNFLLGVNEKSVQKRNNCCAWGRLPTDFMAPLHEMNKINSVRSEARTVASMKMSSGTSRRSVW